MTDPLTQSEADLRARLDAVTKERDVCAQVVKNIWYGTDRTKRDYSLDLGSAVNLMGFKLSLSDQEISGSSEQVDSKVRAVHHTGAKP